MTAAERDGLDIFNKRLKKLEQKQETRQRCTERWNNGERGKAILDEMHELDAQIETARDDLFKAETMKKSEAEKRLQFLFGNNQPSDRHTPQGERPAASASSAVSKYILFCSEMFRALPQSGT